MKQAFEKGLPFSLDFENMLNTFAGSGNVSLSHDWKLVGDSYEIDEDEEIVLSLCKAYKKIKAKELPVRGHSSVTDACRLVRQGKIPAVLWGFGTDTGHADYEYVEMPRVVNSCRVALLAALDFLSGG